MRIAACQMVSGLDVEKNLQHALDLVRSAAHSGAEFIVLPQFFAMMPNQDADLLEIAEEFNDGPIQNALSQVAREEQIWLCAGSLPIRSDDPNRFFDTSILFNPNGEVEARYDKIHLFQFNHAEDSYLESATTQAGSKAVHTSIHAWDGNWHVGMALCFDLRFPELFRQMGTPDIIAVPSAFTTATGRAHWETLVRARAIENQCYVIASAQAGRHENGRSTWGHSIVVDPWGTIIGELTQGEGLLLADIDMERLRQVRQQMPVLKSRCVGL